MAAEGDRHHDRTNVPWEWPSWCLSRETPCIEVHVQDADTGEIRWVEALPCCRVVDHEGHDAYVAAEYEWDGECYVEDFGPESVRKRGQSITVRKMLLEAEQASAAVADAKFDNLVEAHSGDTREVDACCRKARGDDACGDDGREVVAGSRDGPDAPSLDLEAVWRAKGHWVCKHGVFLLARQECNCLQEGHNEWMQTEFTPVRRESSPSAHEEEESMDDFFTALHSALHSDDVCVGDEDEEDDDPFEVQVCESWSPSRGAAFATIGVRPEESYQVGRSLPDVLGNILQKNMFARGCKAEGMEEPVQVAAATLDAVKRSALWMLGIPADWLSITRWGALSGKPSANPATIVGDECV